MKDINNLLKLLSKNSELVVYGLNQTKNAINMGAVKKLLILDIYMKDDNIEKLMDLTENMGGEVTIISNEHDGGKQLEALGGMAAILRYPIS